MGVAFVFMLGLIFLGALAIPAAGVGAFMGRRLSLRAPNLRRRFTIAGALLPFGAAAYVVFCVVAMAILGLSTGRDFGFGDGFDLPLHNGYRWSAIDEPVAACIYHGEPDEFTNCGNDQRDSFYEVLSLQEDGDWLAGSFDGRSYNSFPPATRQPDHWFLFNTRTHERQDASSEADLRVRAAQHGITLQLQSSSDFYSTHRYRWYDAMFVLLLLILGAVLALLVYKRPDDYCAKQRTPGLTL
jgi:hypothetical protein